jgi:hypothetical protein
VGSGLADRPVVPAAPSRNHAMKTCRRAWNVAARRNPGKLPHANPFSAMGLTSSSRETPAAIIPARRVHRGGRLRSDRRRDTRTRRHRFAKVLPRYAKRTMKQVAEGAKKRRAARAEGDAS